MADCSQSNVNNLTIGLGTTQCPPNPATGLEAFFPLVGTAAGGSVFGIPEFLFWRPAAIGSPLDVNGDGQFNGADWVWQGNYAYPASMYRLT